MRGALRLLPLMLGALAGVACSHASAPPQKLPPVADLPSPSLPPWIRSVSPVGRAQNLAQIRIIFTKPIAPVSALEGNGARDVLSHVALEPALAGRFVLLTPRMIGFVADQSLPLATRVRVTLTSGLRDLDGDTLDRDLAWTFATKPLSFSGLPQVSPSPASGSATPAPLNPSFQIVANAPADEASLAAHAQFMGANGAVVAVHVALSPTPSPPPDEPPDAGAAFDTSQRVWTYTITPVHDLDRATVYHFTISSGVEPANGNVATTQAFDGSLRTFDPLAIVPTPTPDPSAAPSSRFASGDPTVSFNNPIDEKTIPGNVTISPIGSPAPKIELADESDIAVDPYALDPDAHYTITVGTGVKDIFGQSLSKAVTIPVDTGDFAPGAWAPSGRTLIPANAGVDINFYATNLPHGYYHAAFAPMSTLDTLQQTDPLSTLPDQSKWPLARPAGAKRNVQSVERINVQRELHAPYGTLAYGFIPDGIGDEEPISGSVQLTNLGVFAQFFPESAFAMVQHLDDGSPAADARVTVYRMPDNQTPQSCATETTASNGMARFTQSELDRCYVDATSGMPALGIVVTSGADLATLQLYDYSGIYNYNVPSGWASGAPSGVGTIFPDRDLYQPGERGEFTGIAYYTQRGEIHADPNARYTLTLTNPSGHKSTLGTVTTDGYGSFSWPYHVPPNAALGYYAISATGERGDTILGDFRVAEFKPPNFKLDVALSANTAAPGSSLTATGTASYLFGAPLAGGKDHVYVTRSYAYLSPKGWDDFSFGRQWFWPEEQPSLESDVLETTIPFDPNGKASVPVTVANDLPAPLRYTVDMDASDVSNLSVSNSSDFLALPADGLIGLASDTVGNAGSPMPIRVIVTGANGKALPGRRLHIELQKMTYVWASQAQEGGESTDGSIKYDTVDRADVTSGDSAVTVNLTPPDAAAYRIRANFAGSSNAASATDMQIFACGSAAADFGTSDTSSVKVTLDKKSYKVGDTATAAIASPFDESDVELFVVRYGEIESWQMHNVHGVARATFTITPQMFPNAALEAVVVRRGAKLSQIKPGSVDSLARVGMAPISIDLHDRYLKLAIAPSKPYVEPGSMQRVDFTARDASGKPVKAKIVAMAVNDAILQLSGYRLPDLVTTIFAQQPISTRFADNRADVTLKTLQAPSEKGFGYGGGFLAGAAGTRVRTNFLPMAYYGTMTSDADGHASATFTLPDDLTTWRVMAVALADDNAHFGTADATFIARLPLMANPLLPQFARPGDRFDIGASVLDQTPSDPLQLVMQLSGALTFASGDAHRAQTQAPPSSQIEAHRFTVVAGTPAPTTVAVTANAGHAHDAFSVPFSVIDRATTESVVEAGAGRGTVTVPIALDRPGTVRITLANSVIPQYTEQAKAFLDDAPLGTANDLAARVILASVTGQSQTLATDLTSLLSLQRDDGGFAYASFARGSDPFATAYVLDALAIARAHGATVSSDAIDRAQTYARGRLADPTKERWCSSALCKAQIRFAMLEGLAATGDRRSSYLSDIYALREQFGSATQLRLARYLLATQGWETTGRAYAALLQQTLYVTGRFATENQSSRWLWRDRLVDAQAEMLRLMLATNAPLDQLDGAARALVAQQCHCGWQEAEAAASAVVALEAYAKRVPPRAMNVSVDAGTTSIARASFSDAPSSKTVTVPSSQIRGTALRLSASNGTLHYVVLYTYGVASDAPGNVTAFHVVRSISAPGSSTALASIDLTSPAAIALSTGAVYDIGIRFAVDHPVDRVVIDDPLPAGFEAIDSTFATSTQSAIPQSDNWEIEGREIYHDRVMAFAEHLDAGVYEMHYLVRSVTPGRFTWPGARVYLQDAPEQFGRTAAAALELK